MVISVLALLLALPNTGGLAVVPTSTAGSSDRTPGLDGESVREDLEFSRAQLHTRNVQVWILRSDGTSVPRIGPTTHIGVGSGGYQQDKMQFQFMRIPSTELSGVVVSVDGRMP
jgi:hypothetical protein